MLEAYLGARNAAAAKFESLLEAKYFKYFVSEKLFNDHEAAVDYVGKRYALPY